MGPAFLDTLYENIHEIVVLFTTNTLVSPSDVQRALQPILIVRSHIEQNRKAVLRMNAAERGVERHLSDGDAHAARALVTEAENSFTVAEYDAFHTVVARMTQD